MSFLSQQKSSVVNEIEAEINSELGKNYMEIM